eukprot:3665923-Pyramimonas_sp.AAC.1
MGGFGRAPQMGPRSHERGRASWAPRSLFLRLAGGRAQSGAQSGAPGASKSRRGVQLKLRGL